MGLAGSGLAVSVAPAYTRCKARPPFKWKNWFATFTSFKEKSQLANELKTYLLLTCTVQVATTSHMWK
jgi:hypothetical protein